MLWAATTVLIRATRLAAASAEKTLLYQLAVSAVLLPLASLAIGEPGIVRLDVVTIAMLLYQGVIVAFASPGSLRPFDAARSRQSARSATRSLCT